MAATCDVAEVARLFRVTEKTSVTWIKSGMPVAVEGKRGRGSKHGLDLAKCVDWYFGENIEKLELDRARTRLANEQAITAALKNAETQRDLVPLSMVEKAWAGLLAELRTNALAIPTKLAPELEGQTVAERKATLDKAVFDLLDRVVAFRPKTAVGADDRVDGEGPDGGEEAAAGDGERVGRSAPRVERRGGGRARKVANKPS